MAVTDDSKRQQYTLVLWRENKHTIWAYDLSVHTRGYISTNACMFVPAFSGKHSATLQLLCQSYPLTYRALPIARYSFIQLGELWQRGVIKMLVSKRQQEDSNPGCLD